MTSRTQLAGRGSVLARRNLQTEIGTLKSPRTLSYVEAVREATDLEMARDPAVILFGLDVDDPKAIQGTTRGLAEKYGPERVFGTPLSEDAMTGAAIGMALAGLRPIHVHIRMDFLMLAMNQLVNVAAKSRFMFGGRVSVPLVVRSMIGRSWGQGAQHSQGLHSLFMHVPGLKVVAPATPYDAKGCLITAIRDDNPVLYIEHRLLCPLTQKKDVIAVDAFGGQTVGAGARADSRRPLTTALVRVNRVLVVLADKKNGEPL